MDGYLAKRGMDVEEHSTVDVEVGEFSEMCLVPAWKFEKKYSFDHLNAEKAILNLK